MAFSFPGASLLKQCESVMEEAFAAGFLVHDAFKVEPVGQCWSITNSGVTLQLRAQYKILQNLDPWTKGAEPEQVISRADFAFVRDDNPVLLVEIDGHDFHERGRKQIQRDRARDRRLLRCGLKVARFTGSEIKSNARTCAAEAFALAVTLGELR